jgi:hypothetical protein
MKIEMRHRLTFMSITVISVILMLISAPTKSSTREFEPTQQIWGRRFTPVSGNVKITPLGSHLGEFCRNDRALLFEDPNGIRILWDPGRTIDENDPRLGTIHLIVISSVHGDHIGDTKPNLSSPGTCAAPGTVSAAPHSAAAMIASKKNAAVFAAGEMAGYLAQKIADYRGAAVAGCAESDDDIAMPVPLSAPCTAALRPGGTRMVKLNGISLPVRIATFQSFHSNGIPSSMVNSPGVPPGMTGYAGNDGGVIIEFTNGLHVYCTGDTGLTGDMKTIVKDYYDINLVVANIGDAVTLGPRDAAFAINNLLTPTSVIPEHVNEAATASGGNPIGHRLPIFMGMVNSLQTAVVIPRSGVTRLFNGAGQLVGSIGP